MGSLTRTCATIMNENERGVDHGVPALQADWEELIIDEDVGAVIVGQDVAFTYAKLAYASLAIQQGAKFVATNPDAADAVGPGLMVGTQQEHIAKDHHHLVCIHVCGLSSARWYSTYGTLDIGRSRDCTLFFFLFFFKVCVRHSVVPRPCRAPGAGAMVAAVEKASGVSPEIYAGKPSAFLLELLKGNYVDMSRTLVVGDRLDTDVAFGKAGGAGMTVLALSGVCTLDDVDAAMEAGGGNVPDHVVFGLPHMLGLEPEDAALLEYLEEDENNENAGERNDLDDYLDEEGFEDDQKAREAFGAA